MEPIDRNLIAILKTAAEKALDSMIESLNLDYAVGNTEFDDVKDLKASVDELSGCLQKLEEAGY